MLLSQLEVCKVVRLRPCGLSNKATACVRAMDAGNNTSEHLPTSIYSKDQHASISYLLLINFYFGTEIRAVEGYGLSQGRASVQ